MKMAYTHMCRDALKLFKEEVYSSYSFFPSALDVGERSASRPGLSLPPENGPPVPIG
jgi:hypothetical protein